MWGQCQWLAIPVSHSPDERFFEQEGSAWAAVQLKKTLGRTRFTETLDGQNGPKGAWLVASLGMKESATQVQDKPESAITHNFQARRARSSCKYCQAYFSHVQCTWQGKLLCTQQPTGRPQWTACTSKDIGCCLLDDLYQIQVIKKDDRPLITPEMFMSQDWLSSAKLPQPMPWQQGTLSRRNQRTGDEACPWHDTSTSGRSTNAASTALTTRGGTDDTAAARDYALLHMYDHASRHLSHNVLTHLSHRECQP